jgi:hypothetical protein
MKLTRSTQKIGEGQQDITDQGLGIVLANKCERQCTLC